MIIKAGKRSKANKGSKENNPKIKIKQINKKNSLKTNPKNKRQAMENKI